MFFRPRPSLRARAARAGRAPGTRRAGRIPARRSVLAIVPLTLVAAFAGTLVAPAAQASATTRPFSAEKVPGPVVLIGTGGVRWSDTGSATPALRSLLREGAVAVSSARSVRTSACPVDGWLAVSAGARAADEPEACRTPDAGTAPPGSPMTAARWDVYRRWPLPRRGTPRWACWET